MPNPNLLDESGTEFVNNADFPLTVKTRKNAKTRKNTYKKQGRTLKKQGRMPLLDYSVLTRFIS